MLAPQWSKAAISIQNTWPRLLEDKLLVTHLDCSKLHQERLPMFTAACHRVEGQEMVPCTAWDSAFSVDSLQALQVSTSPAFQTSCFRQPLLIQFFFFFCWRNNYFNLLHLSHVVFLHLMLERSLSPSDLLIVIFLSGYIIFLSWKLSFLNGRICLGVSVSSLIFA